MKSLAHFRVCQPLFLKIKVVIDFRIGSHSRSGGSYSDIYLDERLYSLALHQTSEAPEL